MQYLALVVSILMGYWLDDIWKGILVGSILWLVFGQAKKEMAQHSIKQLEQKIAEIQAELNDLQQRCQHWEQTGTAPPPPPGPRPGRSDHGYTEPGPTEAPGSAWSIPLDPGGPPAFTRVDADTLRFRAPADETFRWLLEAAHEIGEITYLDRSGPLFEVLCTFLGEPATSLLVTLQGRADGTDALCSAESIEARPGPPTAAVVDVYEHALHQLADPT